MKPNTFFQKTLEEKQILLFFLNQLLYLEIINLDLYLHPNIFDFNDIYIEKLLG